MTQAPLNKILLVEDEEDIRLILRFTLEKQAGFQLNYCASGQEAINKAASFTPDLILMDVMMPGLNGIETFQALKKIPCLSHTPVIFMTAKTQPSEVEEYKKIGAFDVISKPFQVNTLANTLRNMWEKYQSA